MTPFYWIDGFQEYDRAVTARGYKRFKEIFEPAAKEHGLAFELVNIADLFFGFEDRPYIYYNGGEILAGEACARIPYCNPHPQTERLMHSLGRIIAMSGTWRLMNQPLHVDRDKEWACQLASLVGARTIPSCFAPDRTSNRMHIDLIERQLGSYPYIVKPNSLFAGIGVLKVDNRNSLGAILDYCSQSSHAFMIQPFLKDAIDCRIFLEGHQVIACQKRYPTEGGYMGPPQWGRSEAGEADSEIARKSQELSRHVTDGFLCVDWLITADAAYLSEIDLCGMFFGLPEPKRTEVLHAFFRCALRAPKALNRFHASSALSSGPAVTAAPRPI